jgi:hypothetical protein
MDGRVKERPVVVKKPHETVDVRPTVEVAASVSATIQLVESIRVVGVLDSEPNLNPS